MYQKDLSSLDHSSMAMLYQHHALPILRLIRRHVASWEDAEDLALEVFLVALEQEEMLTHLSVNSQLAWLRTVAHHKVVDFYRRSTIRSTLPLEEMTEMLLDDENMTPERVVVRHEEYTILHTHLAALPPQQQEILRLRFAAGLRCREIASLLNKREGTIRSLLSRSLNFLRTIYEKQ